MKISVVTVVYNRAGTIGHTIQSVQDQTYADIEHVIQDGGSSDETIPVIERLAGTHCRFVSESDAGIYDAINRAIARTTGDVVGLMHSDDFFARDDVLSLVADVLADPQIDGVFGDLEYVSAHDPARVIRYWRSGEYSPAKLRRGWMPPHPTVYLRRSVFDRWGLYNTDLRIAADYDAMLRYLTVGQIRLKYIPTVLVRMRVGGESNRSLEHIIKKSLEDLRAIRANGIGGVCTLAMKNARKIGQFIR